MTIFQLMRKIISTRTPISKLRGESLANGNFTILRNGFFPPWDLTNPKLNTSFNCYNKYNPFINLWKLSKSPLMISSTLSNQNRSISSIMRILITQKPLRGNPTIQANNDPYSLKCSGIRHRLPTSSCLQNRMNTRARWSSGPG